MPCGKIIKGLLDLFTDFTIFSKKLRFSFVVTPRSIEIEPIFNKAILFDTTQNSWHGFPEPINPPRGKMRKSIAVYYMTDITSSAQERYRARYVGV